MPGFGWPGSSGEVSSAMPLPILGVHSRTSPFVEHTHGSSGFRKFRGREVVRICFHPACCVCTRKGGFGSGAHCESRLQGGRSGVRGREEDPGGSGEGNLEQRTETLAEGACKTPSFRRGV